MCKAIKEMLQVSRQEGRQEGQDEMATLSEKYYFWRDCIGCCCFTPFTVAGIMMHTEIMHSHDFAPQFSGFL